MIQAGWLRACPIDVGTFPNVPGSCSEKNGITEEKRREFSTVIGDSKKVLNLALKLGGTIKDKPQFVAATIKAIDQSELIKEHNPFEGFLTATLAETVVQGATARARMRRPDETPNKQTTAHFRLEDGTWKLDLAQMIQDEVLLRR